MGLLTVAAALILAPLAAAAQAKVTIAILCPSSCLNLPNAVDAGDRAFLAELDRAGYVLGRNTSIDVSGVGVGPSRLAAAARKLVERKVDVIVAVGNEATRAARQAATDTPIVMTNVTDAAEEGFVTSPRARAGT